MIHLDVLVLEVLLMTLNSFFNTLKREFRFLEWHEASTHALPMPIDFSIYQPTSEIGKICDIIAGNVAANLFAYHPVIIVYHGESVPEVKMSDLKYKHRATID